MATENRKYYLGKGVLRLFRKLASGLPGKQFFTANAPELKLSVAVETKEHVESYSGTNAVDNRVITKSSADGSLTIDELTKDTYELLTKGTQRVVEDGSFVDYVLDSPEIGAVYKLPGTGITDLTVEDSAGTPVVVSNTKYKVDAVYGTIEVLAISGTTGNWKVSADFQEITVVTMLDSTDTDFYLVFEGINLADNSKVLLEIPTTRFEPSSDTDFIGEDYAKYPVKFSVLPDESVTADPNFEELGNFGRLAFLP